MSIRVFLGNGELPEHFSATIWGGNDPVVDLHGDTKDEVRAKVMQDLEGYCKGLGPVTFTFEWD